MSSIRIADFDEVYELHIIKSSSSHDRISFKARLTEAQSRDWEQLARKEVRAEVVDETAISEVESAGRNVFLGEIESIRLYDDNSWFCDIEAQSFSAKMDQERRCRVFQDTKKNLSDIIKMVCKNYEDRIILKCVGTEKISVPGPVIQYQETDWQFIVRITKKYGFDIVVNQDIASAQRGTLWIGRVNRTPREISEDMLVGKEYSSKGFFYRFQSEEIYQVGDTIRLNQKEYSICRCDFYLRQNALVREYGFWESVQDEGESVNFNGIILIAEVTALEGEGQENGRIQVRFEIEEEPATEPIWIDYATAYSDSGIGIYNMPTVGEKVLVHIIDDEGTELVAKDNIRQTKIDSDLKATDKLLRIGEKEILLNDEKISIQNDKTMIVLENEKIYIQTETGNWILDSDELQIDMKKNPINIKAGDIKIEGSDICLSGKKAEINGREIHLKGNVKVT